MSNEHGNLTTRIVDTGTYKYIGEATPGTPTSAAGWRITRIINATGEMAPAGNVGDFDQVWDNRASLTYTA